MNRNLGLTMLNHMSNQDICIIGKHCEKKTDHFKCCKAPNIRCLISFNMVCSMFTTLVSSRGGRIGSVGFFVGVFIHTPIPMSCSFFFFFLHYNVMQLKKLEVRNYDHTKKLSFTFDLLIVDLYDLSALIYLESVKSHSQPCQVN